MPYEVKKYLINLISDITAIMFLVFLGVLVILWITLMFIDPEYVRDLCIGIFICTGFTMVFLVISKGYSVWYDKL